MLVAADLLKDGASQELSTHRIAFLALAGESWDYMGSKRMIWELGQGKSTSGNTVPFNLDDVDKVRTKGIKICNWKHGFFGCMLLGMQAENVWMNLVL